MTNMQLPKIIGRFMFDSITTSFSYKGNKMFSAVYRNPKNGIKMTIFTFFDEQLDKQTFGIKVKGSTIRGVQSFDRVIEVANTIVEENDSFLADDE
ncbi:hypothetical protein UJ101_02661 [Flavobacteriaceae bacterium UJ101]|nr:hypothetical protein UJ101_02661 [Flavobacteriaceae bacterium UJ101]